MPIRIQRRRSKGWTMPPNTVYVGRPSMFGNPFKAKDAEAAGYRDGPKMAVWAFGQWMRGAPDFENYEPGRRSIILNLMSELRGKSLACFCALDQPCHADVLLEIANAPLPSALAAPPNNTDKDSIPLAHNKTRSEHAGSSS